MKSTAFWILDASVLFALSLIYLYQGFHRKNQLFTFWLCAGVVMQLAAAWGLAAGWPRWMDSVGTFFDLLMYASTAGVLTLAITRRDCPVNRSLLWGLSAMLALNLFARYLGDGADPALRTWLRNISFFGPAIFLLVALSSLRIDRLPLWINAILRLSASSPNHVPTLASIALPAQAALNPGMAETKSSARSARQPQRSPRPHDLGVRIPHSGEIEARVRASHG